MDLDTILNHLVTEATAFKSAPLVFITETLLAAWAGYAFAGLRHDGTISAQQAHLKLKDDEIATLKERSVSSSPTTPASEDVSAEALLLPTSDLFKRPARPLPPPDSEFVEINFKQVTGFFRTYTKIRADAMVAPYIGKWIKVSGIVENVREDDFVKLFDELPEVKVQIGTDSETGLFLTFENKWASKLHVLEKGQLVNAIGQIDTIQGHTVHLIGCALR